MARHVTQAQPTAHSPFPYGFQIVSFGSRIGSVLYCWVITMVTAVIALGVPAWQLWSWQR